VHLPSCVAYSVGAVSCWPARGGRGIDLQHIHKGRNGISHNQLMGLTRHANTARHITTRTKISRFGKF
jgi:hypothetical protein